MTPSELVDDIRARLKAPPKGRIRRTAAKAGIAYDTLARIVRGKHDPRIETLDKIQVALAQVEREEAEEAAA